jgi:hypothetical protein
MFTMAPETIVWVSERESAENNNGSLDALLLGAYLAGNAKTQLAAGKPIDDPYSGWKAVIRAYRELQEKEPVRIPAIERLIALETKGKLKAHADEVKARLLRNADAPGGSEYF